MNLLSVRQRHEILILLGYKSGQWCRIAKFNLKRFKPIRHLFDGYTIASASSCLVNRRPTPAKSGPKNFPSRPGVAPPLWHALQPRLS